MIHKAIRTALLVCLPVLASTALAEEFAARLGRVPVDSRNQTSIAGLGQADAELDGRRLTIAGNFAGLLSPATTANLHMGPAVGAHGPVIHSLKVSARADGELDGSVELNREQVEALRAGRIYIQIQSEGAPDGNLWGWLLRK